MGAMFNTLVNCVDPNMPQAYASNGKESHIPQIEQPGETDHNIQAKRQDHIIASIAVTGQPTRLYQIQTSKDRLQDKTGRRQQAESG